MQKGRFICQTSVDPALKTFIHKDMYLLGYDIGSSSVKACIIDSQSGRCISSDFFPKREAAIISEKAGWAEQDPLSWWENLKMATASVLASSRVDKRDIKAIGISYQMHGLVCVDKDCEPLRHSIIWCDSRAVDYGRRAFREIGEKKCLEHLLNSPGNFTASKLAWVKDNEPEIYSSIYKMVPETKGKTLEDMTLLWKKK